MTTKRRPQSDRLRMLTALVGAGFAATGLAQPAGAVDGVIEINQTSVAVNGGFPYVIDTLGSYRLTSDLIVPDADSTAILVTAPNVTLDLNGFVISGVTTCSGAPVTSCAPTGTGIGIDGSAVAGVRVRHGIVRGMGFRGISLGFEAVVEGVRAVGNADDGIRAQGSSRVTRSAALRNGSSGIVVGPGSNVKDSSANENGGLGILSDAASVARRNVSNRNGSRGLDTFALANGNVFVENAVSANGGTGINSFGAAVFARNASNENAEGISCEEGSVIRGNSASKNSAGIFPSLGNGINASGGSSIVANSLRGNSDHGISVTGTGGVSGIARNVITGNGSGSIGVAPGASALETGLNVCGAALCSSP